MYRDRRRLWRIYWVGLERRESRAAVEDVVTGGGEKEGKVLKENG